MANYDSPGTTYDSGVFYDAVSAPTAEKKRMAKIKLESAVLTDDEFAELVNLIYSNINGNATYSSIAPAAAAFLTQKTAFLNKKAERAAAEQTLKSLTTEKNNLRAELEVSLACWAREVETVTGGDKAAIEALGFQTRATAQPIAMTQVLELSLTEGDSAGELDAQWKPVKGAKTYDVQISTDPNNAALWTPFDTARNSKFTLTGLTSGQRVWVRVRAVGGSVGTGKGPWSDPAVKIVP